MPRKPAAMPAGSPSERLCVIPDRHNSVTITTMEDLYNVLEVERGTSQDDIRKAHRKLSRENHPDRNPGNEAASQKFKQVQAAYEVLGDAEKRARYDRFGHAGGRGGPGPIDLSELFGNDADLGSLFAEAFGGGGGRGGGGFGGFGGQPRARRGRDTEATIEIAFSTAAEGGKHGLTVTTQGHREELTITIPPGVSTGSMIRLGGQGGAGSGGGPNGDLLARIKVAPHPYFRREGSTLLVDVPITIVEAALGGQVDVPTLSEGIIAMTVPPGSSSGTKLRLRGKGVTDQKTKQRGDLIAVVKIVAPKDLDDRSRELLTDFNALNPADPRADLW